MAIEERRPIVPVSCASFPKDKRPPHDGKVSLLYQKDESAEWSGVHHFILGEAG